MSDEKTFELAQKQGEKAYGGMYSTPGMSDAIRRAGAESIVLLKNCDGVLPLGSEPVAVFGRCQVDTFFVGYGSGGDVKAPHKVSILAGLKASGINIDSSLSDVYEDFSREHPADPGVWGHWSLSYPEMALTDEVVERAAARDSKAIVIIGRAAGEDGDNTLTKGGYYLSEDEEHLLRQLDSYFNNIIVLLNTGNVIDLSWLSDYIHIKAVMLVWQLGQEMGHAVADVLAGRISPSGHLTQTIAERYEDYPSSAFYGDSEANEYRERGDVGYRGLIKTPEKILFPFGYGLSYTSFDVGINGFDESGDDFRIMTCIRNTGVMSGKGLVQIYVKKPDGSMTLEAFQKSDELAPGETEHLTLVVKREQLAVYDSDICCFVIKKGSYGFYQGYSCTEASRLAGKASVEADEVISQCETITESSDELKQRITERMPREIKPQVKERIGFDEVVNGSADMNDFIAQLTPAELSDLSRGEGPMDSSLAVKGNTGIFGGITRELRDRGIPPVNTSDGPSGLRISYYCALIPIGTALASTWNPLVVQELYSRVADEMLHYGVDIFLGPGMNIQRNPLCGRNFEYYSEDPYLTGCIAIAAVRGIQSHGASACIKHFACNNQELNRNHNNSVVDEKTLREIYLRPFEMVIKEADPGCVMMSYNRLNGVWSHYNYDLATTVLRKEWGYKGLIMTDWWMQLAESPEFDGIKDNAYRVRSGVNVLMPGGLDYRVDRYIHDDNIENSLTLGELQSNARYVLHFIARRMRRDF